MSPEYYAKRLSACYPLTYPATAEELEAICADRGAYLQRVHRLGEWGLYFRCPEAVILLDEAAPPYVLAHELYHHLVADLAEWGDVDEAVTVYVFTPCGRQRQEQDANHFAELLCGPPPSGLLQPRRATRPSAPARNSLPRLDEPAPLPAPVFAKPDDSWEKAQQSLRRILELWSAEAERDGPRRGRKQRAGWLEPEPVPDE